MRIGTKAIETVGGGGDGEKLGGGQKGEYSKDELGRYVGQYIARGRVVGFRRKADSFRGLSYIVVERGASLGGRKLSLWRHLGQIVGRCAGQACEQLRRPSGGIRKSSWKRGVVDVRV